MEPTPVAFDFNATVNLGYFFVNQDPIAFLGPSDGDRTVGGR